MANHEELLETIGGMTVLELSEFVDAFKEKFNVTAVAAAPMAMPGAAGGDAGAAEEKDEFDVVLEGVGDKKTNRSPMSSPGSTVGGSTTSS